jgi:hypothetical protein
VTFSHKKIQTLLNKKFVSARLNTEGCECSGSSFAHEPKSPAATLGRGLGEKNVQLLMLTPKGELLHVISGSIGTDALERELKRALAIWKQVKAQKEPEAQKEVVQAAHAKALKELEKREPDPLEKLLREKGIDRKAGVVMMGPGRDRVDHRYARDHALLPAKDFKPDELAGSGASFFGASTSRKPVGEIGTPRPRRD